MVNELEKYPRKKISQQENVWIFFIRHKNREIKTPTRFILFDTGRPLSPTHAHTHTHTHTHTSHTHTHTQGRGREKEDKKCQISRKDKDTKDQTGASVCIRRSCILGTLLGKQAAMLILSGRLISFVRHHFFHHFKKSSFIFFPHGSVHSFRGSESKRLLKKAIISSFLF